MRIHKQNDLLNKIGVGSTQDLKNRIKNREEQEAETVVTIDITPTWEGTMKQLIVLLEDGTFAGKKFAREEIIKAGQIIDNLIEEYGSES